MRLWDGSDVKISEWWKPWSEALSFFEINDDLGTEVINLEKHNVARETITQLDFIIGLCDQHHAAHAELRNARVHAGMDGHVDKSIRSLRLIGEVCQLLQMYSVHSMVMYAIAKEMMHASQFTDEKSVTQYTGPLDGGFECTEEGFVRQELAMCAEVRR